MTEQQLKKGQELLEKQNNINAEINRLDEQYNSAVKNNRGVWVTFDQRTTFTPNKNQFKFRDTLYNVLREELEKEAMEIQKEFEAL